MAYTVCPNCGQNALPVATRCPKCGVAFESQFIRHAPPQPRRAPVGLILAGAVLTILAGNALWLKFGAAPAAAPFVRKPVPAPAPAPSPALAEAKPAAESLAVHRDTAASAPAPAPRPSIPPAAPPRVAQRPAPSTPAPAVATTVPLATVAAVATGGPAKRLYSSTWLNLRADRRNSAPVLRVLKPGEVVRVDSLSQGWYRVVSDADQPGWVDRRLLDTLPPE